MLDVARAAAEILGRAQPLPTELTSLEHLPGRILAEPVHAERDQPPFDRVTMDGIAVRYERGRKRWRLVGRQLAGQPPSELTTLGDAIEIMTGAVRPHGADTIIPNEYYDVVSGDAGNEIVLESGYQPTEGQHLHARASDHEAGALLIDKGARIGPAEVAIIASAGRTSVRTYRLPKVAVVATGDELVAAGDPIQPHEIRLSNAPALVAAVNAIGPTESGWHHLPDDKPVLRDALATILEANDVVLLSGGVSRGKADYVPEVLEALGATCHFHRVAQKPGKPLWFGSTEGGCLVFGLPGNPVSTLACFCRYVRPALITLMGQASERAVSVRLGAEWQFSPRLTALVPVVISSDEAGVSWARPLGTNTSGDFTALAGADGFVELPAADSVFEVGRTVAFYGWR
ncbi:MAG: molybdopterin molybdotransferase MoeA [Myxococcota bacterium]